MFIYMGQEYGNKHLPELFEKDVVDLSYFDEEIYLAYVKAINRKKHQLKIIDCEFTLIDKDIIRVKNTYIDNSIEEKEFFLGKN